MINRLTTDKEINEQGIDKRDVRLLSQTDVGPAILSPALQN